jgi:hypothetical protein
MLGPGGMTQVVKRPWVGSLVLQNNNNNNNNNIKKHKIKLIFPKQKQPKMIGSLYHFSIPEHYFLHVSSRPLAPSTTLFFFKQFWCLNPGLGHAKQALYT